MLILDSTDQDLYWIADANFYKCPAWKWKEAFGFAKISITNMTNVTEILKNVTEIFFKKYRCEFSKQFEGSIVSVLLMHVCFAKTK